MKNCEHCLEALRQQRERAAARYHEDPEYRERRKLQGREYYRRNAEVKRATVYVKLAEAGKIRNPKLLVQHQSVTKGEQANCPVPAMDPCPASATSTKTTQPGQ